MASLQVILLPGKDCRLPPIYGVVWRLPPSTQNFMKTSLALTPLPQIGSRIVHGKRTARGLVMHARSFFCLSLPISGRRRFCTPLLARPSLPREPSSVVAWADTCKVSATVVAVLWVPASSVGARAPESLPKMFRGRHLHPVAHRRGASSTLPWLTARHPAAARPSQLGRCLAISALLAGFRRAAFIRGLVSPRHFSVPYKFRRMTRPPKTRGSNRRSIRRRNSLSCLSSSPTPCPVGGSVPLDPGNAMRPPAHCPSWRC